MRRPTEPKKASARGDAGAGARHGDGDVLDGTFTAQPALGAELRRIRLERGHALTEVANATGISTSFLSVVEKGRSDITLGRLMRLLSFYGVRIGSLLPDAVPRDRIVTRPSERTPVSSPEGVEVFLLAPDTNRKMMPVLGTHQPRSRIGELPRHPGEVFVFVLEGTLLFEREAHDPFVLHEGDSGYYTGDSTPVITNIGEREARVVAVVTPPTL